MADFIPVTRTKIVVPRRRAELLSRRRLLDLLDELMDNQLIIVAAPAGYGKTSLLVDYASSTQWPFCWYALDSLDQDPQRFIAHFISSLSVRFPNFGKNCMAALQSMSQDRLDLDLLVSMIVNDAYENITEHFVMVLDDFHLVENSRSVVYFVNRFIQDVDENCHLVLASRSLLTLPDLPLMVARSLVGGLSFEELGFQPEEIQGLLNQNYHLSISMEEASDLAKESEGWVTGLLLSTHLMGKMITNQMRVARVSGVGLYEYLAQQVLDQQTPEVQKFLLRTSLLDEFDLNLCEDVIGKALGISVDWRGLIDSIMRLNLFVLPVGEGGTFIRYHHLFLDFLRDRVRREYPEETRQILLGMAETYTARREWERAYQIYQSMGEAAAVVRLIEDAGSVMIGHGQLITLTEWLASLSEDLRTQHPMLLSHQGTVAFMRGEPEQGVALLDRAVAGQRPLNDPVSLAQTLCRRSAAYRFLGQYREALKDADEAISLLVDNNESQSLIYADALASKGSAFFFMGQLNEALHLLNDSIQAYQVGGDEVSAAKVWVQIGSVAKKLGKVPEAEDAYRKSLEYYQAEGNLVWQANLYNNLGVLQHANGDYVTATNSFERAIHYAKVGGSPRLEAYALTSIGDLYQELDAVAETLEAYKQAREIAQQVQDGYLLLYLNLAEARLKQTQGEFAAARDLLVSAQSMAVERGSAYEDNICRFELGRIKLAEGQLEDAYFNIAQSLEYFVKEGYQEETPRAHLYLLVCVFLLDKADEVESQIKSLQPLLEDKEKHKLLIAGGREVQPYLEKMRDAPAVKSLVPAVLALLEQHNANVPAIRRVIRRHAGVVPFAPPKMIIRTLGKVQIKVSDHVVTGSDWQVQTARDLFLLLLAHPEGLTKEAIGAIFWEDSTTSELKLRFKNTMYRLRHAAGKDAILFQGDDVYLFNREMDYEYDAETFLKEIAQAEKAETSEKRAAHYQSALRFYRGPYLPELDDEWVIIERERLYQIHMDALLKLAEMAENARNYEKALEFCQRALKEDSCQEDAHRISMRVYAAMGKRALVVRQYEMCRQALMSEVDAPPSYQTQSLYETLIQ